MEKEAFRGSCGALIIGAAALLCLVALMFTKHKPCYVPDEQKIGSMKIAEQCGTERERQAVNDE